MSLLDKLKGLFLRKEIPDETRKLFESARSTGELLRGLDNLLTRNEVEFKELDHEISKLEALETSEVGKVQAGVVSGRQKRNTLLYVRRLRKQMDNYEKRLRIYDRNMNLHLNLIGKIQDVEAMNLRGVNEGRIDAIIMGFEENLEKYNETMHAAEVLDTTSVSGTSTQEERELQELERELTAAVEEPAAETEPVAETAEAEPVAETAPVVEAPPVREPVRQQTTLEARADIEHLVEQDLASEGVASNEAAAKDAAPSDEELDRMLLEE